MGKLKSMSAGRLARASLAVIMLLLLVACLPDDNVTTSDLSTEVLRGSLLLWHYWEGEDLSVLNGLIEQFEAIYDGVDVIALSKPVEEIAEEFPREVLLGFGPDVLLVPNYLAGLFSERNLLLTLSELDPEGKLDNSHFRSAALDGLTYGEGLYGLPITMDSYALFYNTDLVSSPATTLDALLAEARAGKPAALRMTFFAGVWGVSAYGGDILNDTGQIVVNQGGFKPWLRWMVEAQNIPGMLLSSDAEALYESFVSGENAYYTGTSREIASLNRDMPRGNFAVTRLPRGPEGLARPYLETEALLFGRVADTRQRSLARAFGTFLVAAEQQRSLMRTLDRLPANTKVRIDPALNFTLGGIAEQVRTAKPFRGDPVTRELVFGQGHDIYDQVLGGVLLPPSATAHLSALNTAFGMDVPVSAPDDVCARISIGCL